MEFLGYLKMFQLYLVWPVTTLKMVFDQVKWFSETKFTKSRTKAWFHYSSWTFSTVDLQELGLQRPSDSSRKDNQIAEAFSKVRKEATKNNTYFQIKGYL